MADNLNVKDASNTTVTIVTKDTGSGVQLYKHAIADATTPAQTAAVSAGGALKVDASATTQPVSASALPLPTGAATETTLGGVLTTSDFDTKAGSLTETAPASDTASSGLNGRLQRIAQRISSLITALGSPFQAGGSIGNSAFGATQSGTWTVQPGNTANTTAWKVDGSAVTQPVSVASTITTTQTPATSGGLSTSKTISAASTNATSVKGSAGQLYALQAFNNTAIIGYLKLYNKASAPTVGSDTPVKTILIPSNASGAGCVINFGDSGIAFSLGIAFALTTGIADADTGAVAASAYVVNVDYK